MRVFDAVSKNPSLARSLWLTIGIILLVGYFLPIGYNSSMRDATFTWNLFSRTTTEGLALFFVFSALVGIGFIVIPNTVKGIALSITMLSMGFLGWIFMFIGTSAPTVNDFSLIIPMIQMLALSALISGNSIRMGFRGSYLAKMLSGLGGSVFTALVILGVIIFIQDIRHVSDKAALLIPYILSQLAFLAAGIISIVSFSDSTDPAVLSKASQILLICGYLLLAFGFFFWILLAFSSYRGAAEIWLVLLVARFFFYSLAFLSAIVCGFVALMIHTVYKVEA